MKWATLKVNTKSYGSRMDIELEFVTLVFNIAALALLFSLRAKLDQGLVKLTLVASYCFYLIASLATVVEHHYAPQLMNILEHSSYALSALCFLAWCHQILVMTTEESDS